MLPEPTDTPPFESVRAEITAETTTPPAVREPFWGYSDVFLFLGLSLAALALVGVFVGLWSARTGFRKPSGTFLLVLQLVLYVMFYAAGRFIFSLRYQRPLLTSLGWRRSAFNRGIMAVVGVALAFLVSAIASALHTPKISTPIDQLVDSPLSFLLFALTAVIIAPFFEEFFFRGLLQPLFSRTFGVIAGIVLTAALFGAAHGYEYAWAWQYILAIFLAGVVFGAARARTKSIIPPIIMHCCYNAVFLIAFAVAKQGRFK